MGLRLGCCVASFGALSGVVLGHCGLAGLSSGSRWLPLSISWALPPTLARLSLSSRSALAGLSLGSRRALAGSRWALAGFSLSYLWALAGLSLECRWCLAGFQLPRHAPTMPRRFQLPQKTQREFRINRECGCGMWGQTPTNPRFAQTAGEKNKIAHLFVSGQVVGGWGWSGGHSPRTPGHPAGLHAAHLSMR